MEFLFVLAALALGLIPVWILGRRAPGPTAAISALAVAITAGGMTFRHQTTERRAESLAAAQRVIPATNRPDGYVTSSTCKACHPAQFESWHASYHRTMTQVATPASVVGDFNDVSIVSRGLKYHLHRRGDEFWATMPDPVWEQQTLGRGLDPASIPNPPYVDRRIIMTTGSHHMQFYWFESKFDRTVFPFPFGYIFEQQRWVGTEHSFLQPPENRAAFVLWNTSCIKCHSVAGQPLHEYGTGKSHTQVAELGIACEACHGPAHAHVEFNRDPQRRYQQHLSEQPDGTIVNPARLSSRKQSEVCGQCHSITWPKSDAQWNLAGTDYRAGGTLTDTVHLLRHPAREDQPIMRQILTNSPGFLAESWWPDGMIRISGRDYSAMVESPCYQRGALSCMSCHAMHASDPDDQLAARMDGDEACLQCHSEYRDNPTAHTHHAAGSSGSRCYNCHMPHTTYGLLKAIRSHEINSPTAKETLAAGRPNACNLCHIDQTLAWTARYLNEWYQQPAPELDADHQAHSLMVLHALRGDAGQRALAAWHLGWGPARAAGVEQWQPPILAQLLNDPYSAVRFIAERSLRSLPGFAEVSYDALAAPREREAAAERVRAQWGQAALALTDPQRVLLRADGTLLEERLREIAAQRDDRPVMLAE